jgi:serine protease Do
MGLVLSDLTDDQRKELDIRNGVLIEDITGNARGNIQAGDVILAVISKGATIDARNAEQVNALIAKLEKGAAVTFLLRRGDAQFYSSVKIGNDAD